MSEYIKREDAIEAITDCIMERLNWRTNSSDERQGLNVALCAIEDVPAASVAKRKRGKWIGGELGHCSCCGHEGCASDIWNDGQINFCPHCGANMRGET